MPVFSYESTLPATAETVWAWLARPLAFQRLVPPWLDARLLRYEGLRNGARSTIKLGLGPFRKPWIAEHRDVVEGKSFRDVQVEGPFREWDHVHELHDGGDGQVTLRDEIRYELPSGLASMDSFLRTELTRQFAYRHRILAQDLEAHRKYGAQPLRIAITGASGLLGSQLGAFLSTGGHQVIRLVRRAARTRTEVSWDPRQKEIDAELLEGLDAVIHLAGENIFALRWSEPKKERIYRSRAEGTRFLAETLAQLSRPPKVLLSASGVAVYGDRGSEWIDESSPTTSDSFLARVSQAWEEATEPARAAGIPTIRARTGVVLTPAGGALRLMLPAFKLGLGARAGSRNQYFPWISLDDIILGYYHAAATGGLSGPMNLTSPEPVTMDDLTRTLARVLKRPAFLAVPPDILRGVMGEAAEELLLTSARIYPRALIDSGYDFAYPALEQALRHQLGYL